jgi:hypothetical protein
MGRRYTNQKQKFSLPGCKALLKSDLEYEVALIDAIEAPCERSKKDKHIGTLVRKKRQTLKSEVIVSKKTQRIICAAFANGKHHDFRLFK